MKSKKRSGYESPGSLYQRILGPNWRKLSPVVQRSFAGDCVREGRGTFTVQSGKGVLARLYCWLGRLPPNGEEVAVGLKMTPTKEGEIWRRSFGGHILKSHQTEGDGLLVERFGPVEFRFRLTAREGALHLIAVSSSLCIGLVRIPIPRPLAPGGRANNWEEASGGMGVSVEIRAPLTGLICSYRGVIEIL